MLSKNGIIIRFISVFCLFFISGTGILTGWAAGICGILGTIELATALMGYSPLVDWLSLSKQTKRAEIKFTMPRTE